MPSLAEILASKKESAPAITKIGEASEASEASIELFLLLYYKTVQPYEHMKNFETFQLLREWLGFKAKEQKLGEFHRLLYNAELDGLATLIGIPYETVYKIAIGIEYRRLYRD